MRGEVILFFFLSQSKDKVIPFYSLKEKENKGTKEIDISSEEIQGIGYASFQGSLFDVAS